MKGESAVSGSLEVLRVWLQLISLSTLEVCLQPLTFYLQIERIIANRCRWRSALI